MCIGLSSLLDNLCKFVLTPLSMFLLQRRWLNAYHKKVQEEVAEKVLKPAGKTLAYDWVTARTKPIPDTPTYTSHAHKGSSTPTILCLAMLLVTALMRV